MTDLNPITPPPALRQLWAQQAQRMNPRDPIAWQEDIANQASQWGANKELEACCEWLEKNTDCHITIEFLRAASRTEPPRLKEQALAVLDDCANCLPSVHGNTIRRALEALDD